MSPEPDFGEEFDTSEADKVEFPSSVSLARDYLEAQEARKNRDDQRKKLAGPKKNRFRKRPETGHNYAQAKYNPRARGDAPASGGGGGRGGGGGGGGDN